MTIADYPKEVIDLKTFKAPHNSPYANPYGDSLYRKVDSLTCRRCGGSGADPEYPTFCTTCCGTRKEQGKFNVCVIHPDRELVRIGKRHVEWEDAMGFDCKGYLEVKGCPICQEPAYSET